MGWRRNPHHRKTSIPTRPPTRHFALGVRPTPPLHPHSGRADNTAHFYSVVARDTVDADFAQHRQRFLAEQGYSYRIIDGAEVGTDAAR
nr:hypothetical protein [Propionibacterium freudenreichii]